MLVVNTVVLCVLLLKRKHANNTKHLLTKKQKIREV